MRKTITVLGVIFCCVTSAFSDLKATGGFSAPYFQADYIQDISEYTAALINPALLYRVNQMHFDFGIYRWNDRNSGVKLFEDLGYQQLAALFPIRLNYTTGLTIISCGAEYIKKRIDPSGQILPAGTDDYWETWIIPHFSYKFRSLPQLSIGTNVKVVLQKQFVLESINNTDPILKHVRKIGVGIDLGVYYNFFDHYRYGDFSISLNFQDIVPANIPWENPAGDQVTKELMTTRFRGGLRYAIMNDRLIMNAEAVVDNLFQDLWKGVIEANIGSGPSVEDLGALKKQFRLSGHAKFQWIPQLWIKAGWANNLVPYVGFNTNVIYLWPEMINNVALDVHFGYSLLEEERGSTGMVKIAADIGPTREQRESKRLYEQLILAPMDIYNKAMRLYTAGKFWDASFVFGKLLSLYPSFHLCDKATYYMGDCYTQLRLNQIARQVFKEALAEFTTSQVRAKYLYGLQYLDYREGKYKDALKNHAFITNLYAQDDIRPEADYLAGEIHFVQKNYSAASQILENIPSDAVTYSYAQYTLSIINIENNKIDAAIQNLTNVISNAQPADESEQQLIYAAEVKLGQLYFEQVELRKAVEAFKRVPEGSVHGDEALMGIAWSWIKANRPQECLRTVDQLIAMHPNSPLTPEAYLVKGYSQMLLKSNEPALRSFTRCVELCKTEFADQDDLRFKRQKFDEFYIGFMPAENKIKKNALRKPTDKIIAERDGLKMEFEKYSKESKDYFVYKLMVEDNKKFFRRKDQVLLDAEYAIAKVSKMIGVKEQTEIIEKTSQQQEQIDDEIEKLKRQLENIDENNQ